MIKFPTGAQVNLENTASMNVITRPHARQLNEREKLVAKLTHCRSIVVADMWEVARGLDRLSNHLVLKNRWQILKNDLKRVNSTLSAISDPADDGIPVLVEAVK